MIKYRLTCADGHDFESWFASSADFDRVSAAGHLSCAVCGGPDVEKALMAARVANSGTEDRPLSRPASAAEQAVRALRAKIEAHSEDMGRDFATEARKIHDGDAPERPIHGQAKATDARALIEDGIPIAPLPWGSKRTN